MFEDGLRYQDARMASEDEMKRDLYGFHINDSRRIPKGGPILFRESDMAYVDPSEVHSLIVGDTGSMKTLRFVLPLIYSCAKALDLDFIDVGFEEYDFVTYEKYLELPSVQEFIYILKSEAFKSRLDMLGGYSCEECGRICPI